MEAFIAWRFLGPNIVSREGVQVSVQAPSKHLKYYLIFLLHFDSDVTHACDAVLDHQHRHGDSHRRFWTVYAYEFHTKAAGSCSRPGQAGKAAARHSSGTSHSASGLYR